MNVSDQLVELFGKVKLINFEESKIKKKLFGAKQIVEEYETSLLSMKFAGGPPLDPLHPDVEHGINFNDNDLVQGNVEAVHHIPVDPIPNLTFSRTNCDKFVLRFFSSNLLVLPDPATTQKISFYSAPMNVTNMFKVLRDKMVLHRMLLLDYVARSVELSLPEKRRRLDKIAYEYNKALFQGKITEYLLQHKDRFLEFVHSETNRMTQHSMISSILAQVRKDIVEAWENEGGRIATNSMYDPKSPFSQWWAVVSDVLLIGAKDLDDTLLCNNIKASNVNLLYGFHMTCSANPSRTDITLQAYCEQATGQQFRLIEPVAAIELENTAARSVSKKHINKGKINISTGVVVRETKKRPAVVTAPPSPEQEPLPAHAAKKSRDTAYWVKIDPQYLLPRVSRDWCAPGMVIGIYPAGAGPAAVDALVVCVVTSQPSSLELPQPFAGAEEEPESLYLEVAIAIGVQGRVPVIMEDDVLKRFYKGSASRELFFTDRGRVDFEDDVNKINYSTAKFIGDAMYDAGRFDEHGQLKMDFQNVRAVHVLVSYRAVPESQIRGMIRDAVVYVQKRFVSLRLFSAVALLYAVALMCVVFAGWHLYALLKAENSAAVQVSGATLRGTLSMMLHNTTFLASLGLVLPQMPFSLKLGNSTSPSRPNVEPSAPFLPPFARNYKAGTVVSTVTPPPSANIPSENWDWVNVVHTTLMSTPPPAVMVVWSAKPLHKSVGVIQAVQRRAVGSSFLGGVYYLNSNYGLDQTDYLLFSLGHQMFGTHHDYTNASHYPAFFNSRLLLHNESVLVVLDNAIDINAVRAVAAAVRGAGVVVVTAREPLVLPDAVYVDVQAHMPAIVPVTTPVPESKPESNVENLRSPPTIRSPPKTEPTPLPTSKVSPKPSLSPVESGSHKPAAKPATKPAKKWSNTHSRTAAGTASHSAAFHNGYVGQVGLNAASPQLPTLTADPQSRENTRAIAVDAHSEQIAYNGGEDDRFTKNVNKVVREAKRIKNQWRAVKDIFGMEL